jgi:subtilisin family serine protease
MAAPFVAGVAALYLDQNSLLTPADVKQQVVNNGVRSLVGDRQGTEDVMVSSAKLYESALMSRTDTDEMCADVFGSCGGGIGCCDNRFCLPFLGLCFLF